MGRGSDGGTVSGPRTADLVLAVGTRLEVLFDDPPQYFAGTVKSVGKRPPGKEKRGRLHLVHYDDGTTEEVDLCAEDTTYRLIVKAENEREEEKEFVEDSEVEDDVESARKRYRGRRRGYRQVLESTTDCVNDSEEDEEPSLGIGGSVRKYRRIALRKARGSDEHFKHARASQHSSKEGSTDGRKSSDVGRLATPSQSPVFGRDHEADCVLETQAADLDTPKQTKDEQCKSPEAAPGSGREARPSPLFESMQLSSERNDVVRDTAPQETFTPPPLKQLKDPEDEDEECVPESQYSLDLYNTVRQTIEESPVSSLGNVHSLSNPRADPQEIKETPEQPTRPSSIHAVSEREVSLPGRLIKGLRGDEDDQDDIVLGTFQGTEELPASLQNNSISKVALSGHLASRKKLSIMSGDALGQAPSNEGNRNIRMRGQAILADTTNAKHTDWKCDSKRVSGLFQLASGKTVNISDDALAKARAVLSCSPSRGDEIAIAEENCAPEDSKCVSGLFQLASGKTVNISDDALAKARAVLSCSPSRGDEIAIAEENCAPEDSKRVSGLFQLASGKTVNISDDALAKARAVLNSGAAGNDERSMIDHGHGERYDNVSSFRDGEGKIAGRAGVPNFQKDLAARSAEYPVFEFGSGECKVCEGKTFYDLEDGPGAIKYEDLESLNTRLQGTHFDPFGSVKSALQRAKFSCTQFLGSPGRLVSDDWFLKCMREEGYSKVTPQWVAHHSKMITIKLLRYELQFQNLFGNRLLCAEAIYSQLCRRYKKEIVDCKWSSLHRILMREEQESRSMILSVTNIMGKNAVELSDGWYTITAQLDHLLCLKLSLGKIFVGMKVCVSMCQLHNSRMPCHPLERDDAVYLALHYNGVFPAKFNAKLGFKREGVPLVGLPQVQPAGGIVPSTLVLIEKQYPLVFMERHEDGRMVKRGQASEQEATDRFESQRERIKEEIQEKMQNECREEDLMDEEKVEALTREFHNRVEKSFREHSLLERNVATLLNFRVSQVVPAHNAKQRSAIISMWRPTEELKDLLSPGRIFKVFNLMPKPIGNNPDMIHLEATRATHWIPVGTMSEQDPGLEFEMNDPSCDSVATLTQQRMGHEFDFSGALIKCQRINEREHSVFMVSLGDLGGDESESWLLRVTVDAECAGLANLRQAKPFQTLSFQSLSFDFTDFGNSVVNCKAGIQSICARKMVGTSALASSRETALMLRRVQRLTHA